MWPFAVVAIAVVLLVSTLFVLQVKWLVAKARVSKARDITRIVLKDVQVFRDRHGRLPSSLDEMRLPEKDFEDGFLDFDMDVWGHPYQYFPGPGRGYTIRSLGADGLPGGEGEDADIVLEVPGTPE